jgi:FkbM family methyltransferase
MEKISAKIIKCASYPLFALSPASQPQKQKTRPTEPSAYLQQSKQAMRLKTVDEMWAGLLEIHRLTRGSRWSRFLSRPLNYAYGIGFRKMIYPVTKRSKVATVKLIDGREMKIPLPGAMDVFLFGAKTHDSEIRLSKFLLLHPGACRSFVDVGAHIGFFSRLVEAAASAENRDCHVLAVEPSPVNFQFLSVNTRDCKNTRLVQAAVSATQGETEFFQFPELYAEYNSLNREQYTQHAWFRKYTPEKIVVKTITLDRLADDYSVSPTLIKIDVEGAEAQVIRGATAVLTRYSPYLILEFLSDPHRNRGQQQAHELLLQHGYAGYAIDENGKLISCPDPQAYLDQIRTDSDNFFYCHASKKLPG